MPTPTRSARIWAELTGLGAALCLALIGLLHIVITARSEFLFNDGDSVLMPLIANSFNRGEPFQWVMSTTLFFPEIAQYLAVHWVCSDTHVAIAAAGVLNIVMIYGAIRLLAASTMRSLSASRQVAASLGGLGLFVALGLLEAQPGGVLAAQFEVFTMSYTLTYYSSTLIATILVLAAVAALPRCRGWQQRSWLLIGVAVVSALSALSNPLFLGWATIPIGIVVLWLALRHASRTPGQVRLATLLLLALGAGSLIGYRSRVWFEPFLGVAHLSDYVHLGQTGAALGSLLGQLGARFASPLGAIAVLLLAASVVWMLFCFLRGLRVEQPGQAALLVYPTVTAGVLALGVLVTGQAVPRYLLPMFLIPVLTLPLCALTIWPELGSWRPSWLDRASLRPSIRIAVGGLTALLLIVAGISVANIRNAKADCLHSWLSQQDGRLVGAGGFWTIREISTYLPDQIILQTIGATNYSWMTNLATFAQPEIDYVLVSDSDVPLWGTSSANEFQTVAGDPAAIVQCDGFQIWDYRGTGGQQVLYSRIVLPAIEDRMARFGCTSTDDQTLCETAKQQATF